MIHVGSHDMPSHATCTSVQWCMYVQCKCLHRGGEGKCIANFGGCPRDTK